MFVSMSTAASPRGYQQRQPGDSLSLDPSEPLFEPEEEAAHAEEDEAEQAEFEQEQAKMGDTMAELESNITEKEQLMEQLTRSQRAFHSMKQRYEMKMNEMEVSMREMSKERASLMQEVEAQAAMERQEQSKAQGSRDQDKANKAEKARAEAEGRLSMLDTQMKELRKKQKEAERVRRSVPPPRGALSCLSVCFVCVADEIRGRYSLETNTTLRSSLDPMTTKNVPVFLTHKQTHTLPLAPGCLAQPFPFSLLRPCFEPSSFACLFPPGTGSRSNKMLRSGIWSRMWSG